ncbi:MAG: hypothetical protein AB7P04_03210 [Bacteriovoracia bacterium]
MKKILLAIVVIIFLLAGAAFYSIIYTPLPLKLIESALKANGVQISGMTGSLNSGMSIETLEFKNADLELNLKNARFQYAGLSRLMAGELLIEDVNLDQGTVKILKTMQGRAQGSGSSGATSGGRGPIFFKTLRVKMVNISNVSVYSSAVPSRPFVLDRMMLQELVVNQKGVKAERFMVNSGSYDLDVPALEGKAGSFHLSAPIQGKLKAAALTWLKQDVPFTVVTAYSPAGLDLQFQTFDGKLTITHKPTVMLLAELKDFNPQDHLVTDLPFSAMNVKLEIQQFEAILFGTVPVSGSFKAYDALFQITQITPPAPGQPNLKLGVMATSSFTRPHGTQNERFEIDFKPNLMGIATGAVSHDPWLRLDSNFGLPPAPTLARLHYQKAYEELDDLQKAQLDKEAALFAAGPGIQPLLKLKADKPKKGAKGVKSSAKPHAKKKK